MKPGSLSHIQVAAQLAGVLLACYPVGLVNRGAPWWLALCLPGALFGLWALWHNRIGNFSVYPEPRDNAHLVTSGPYRLVRHPMYSALVLMMLGIAGYNGHILNLVGLVLVVVAVTTKAVREERYLQARFSGYADYARATPRFLPIPWTR